MTDQHSNSGNPLSDDPRLLLPEWLRDDPPERETLSSGSPSNDRPDIPISASDSNSVDPLQPDPVQPRSSANPSGEMWRQPPPRVESYDPSQLIGAADLPPWIRDLASKTQQYPAKSSSVKHSVEIERDSDENAGVSASSSVSEVSIGSPEIAPAENTRRTDLSETGFVLIAGATLIIIAAVLALFYL